MGKGRWERYSTNSLDTKIRFIYNLPQKARIHGQPNEGKDRMRIQIDPHTLERAAERGTKEEEIKDVINTGLSLPGKYGRFAKFKILDFMEKRHGKFYHQKRVEVFYTIQEDVIITATVYVFYGKWGVKNANSI